MNNRVDSDDIVGVSSKEGLSVSRPCKGDRLWDNVALLWSHLDLIDDALALEVPDLDSSGGSSAQPVAVRRKDEGIDDVASFQGVEVLVLVQVPEHGDSVPTSGSAEGSVRGDGDGVDVAGVSVVVGLQFALGDIPDLDELVPSGRDKDRVEGVWGESDGRDPFGVAVVGDGVLALSEGVPQLDGLVTGGGDDLAVIRGEADGEDVVGVSDESAGGLAGGDVPEAKGLVPGSRQCKLPIRRNDDILNKMVVASQGATSDPIALLVSGQVPDDDGLVS